MADLDASGLAGQAFVAIWHDIAPEGLATFYEWHNREHMPERLAVPGFRRGRRYIRVGGEGQEFFNLYEVDAFDVLVGPDYLARLNAPTPWTKQAVAHFRNVTRGLCRVEGSKGIGQGGVVATARFAAQPDCDEVLKRYLNESAAPLLLQHVGAVGVHLGITDSEGSGVVTAERRERNNPTDIPSWVFLVEGISANHLQSALAEARFEAELAAHGAAAAPILGFYQLEAALNSPPRA